MASRPSRSRTRWSPAGWVLAGDVESLDNETSAAASSEPSASPDGTTDPTGDRTQDADPTALPGFERSISACSPKFRAISRRPSMSPTSFPTAITSRSAPRARPAASHRRAIISAPSGRSRKFIWSSPAADGQTAFCGAASFEADNRRASRRGRRQTHPCPPRQRRAGQTSFRASGAAQSGDARSLANTRDTERHERHGNPSRRVRAPKRASAASSSRSRKRRGSTRRSSSRPSRRRSSRRRRAPSARPASSRRASTRTPARSTSSST